MTDLATLAPLAVRRPDAPPRKRPQPGFGTALVAALASLAGAFRLAYVDPYTGRGHLPQPAPRSQGDDWYSL